MADSDGYVRGETLEILMNMLDEDILNEAFKEDISTTVSKVKEINSLHITLFFILFLINNVKLLKKEQH